MPQILAWRDRADHPNGCGMAVGLVYRGISVSGRGAIVRSGSVGEIHVNSNWYITNIIQTVSYHDQISMLGR